jgi:HK97 family phage prohead protease
MCENCENKQLDHSVKSISAEVETPNKKGEFVFTASTESTDREGDVIKADGWVLDNFKSGGVLLWGHNQDKLPVGKVLWVKQKDGELLGKARFNGQTQLSKDVEKLVRMGDLTGISVGFRALESEKTHEGRMFTKQELLEVSVVNVPANPDAVIHTIKNLDLKSDNVKLNLYKSMETETEEKEEEKATMDECIENKISIIMEENPEMDNEQAYAIAHEMCMDKADVPEDEMKEEKAYRQSLWQT